MRDVIFEVTEDEVDAGYSAIAIGYGIHTQRDSMTETWRNAWEPVDCYFDARMDRPGVTCLNRETQLMKPTEQHGAQGRRGRQAHG